MCMGECGSDCRDINNNLQKSELTSFENDSVYFQQVIRPMLAPGHESEFIFWLKCFGMIPNNQVCKNAAFNQDCNKAMSWVNYRAHDLYQWKCNNCSEKKSIREGSVFSDVKCNFNNVIRVLLGWCKSYDYESLAAILDIKKSVICTLYNIAARVAEDYIKQNIGDFQIGGPNKIVLIDTYPAGCGNYSQNRGHRPILCLCEVKTIPQKFWFQSLDRTRCSQVVQTNKVKILQAIREVVRPGSILIAPMENNACSYNDLLPLKDMFPTIISVETLRRHNTNRVCCEDNLDVIWRKALDVCEQAQFYNHMHIQQYLTSYMWQQMFGAESFERLLHQFSIHN